MFFTLSQISSNVSRIATKRKQLSASEYPAGENENIPRGKNAIIRSSGEFHIHPFENKEFRQLCEIRKEERRVLFFVSFLFLLLFYKVVKIWPEKVVLEIRMRPSLN